VHIHPLGAPHEERYFVATTTPEEVFLGFQPLVADRIRGGFEPRIRRVAASAVASDAGDHQSA
jgi:hypothetical protein